MRDKTKEGFVVRELKSRSITIRIRPSTLDEFRRAALGSRRTVNDSIELAMIAWTEDVKRHYGRLPEIPEGYYSNRKTTKKPEIEEQDPYIKGLLDKARADRSK